jgi:hypothetical protein
MKTIRNFLFRPFMTLLVLFAAAACQKNSSQPGSGLVTARSAVNIYLTDDPSLVFDSVWLDIQKLEIKAEDSAESREESDHQNEVEGHDQTGDTSLGWVSVPIHPGVYNILRFRNGLDTLFAAGSFPAIKGLKKVRVTLGVNNSVIFQGTQFPLSLKGNDKFIVIRIDESTVQINNGGLTNFWIDIDAGQSIKMKGSVFELKPNVKVFSKDKAAQIEGRILPQDANAVVMAFNATDTATAKPESEGEFRIIGLKPGTYSLQFHSTANHYLDTTINNIRISEKDDIKVGTITLHK